MAASSTSSPATLPLPGGRDGATVKVQPLRTADMEAPMALYKRPAGRFPLLHAIRDERVWLPIPAFLVEHPEAGPFLIDTGMHEVCAADPAANLGQVVARLAKIRMEPEWAVPEQLRARGIDPAGIRLVVMTHLHYDHASGVSQFPGATFIADAPEWVAASRGRMVEGYRTALIDHPVDWRTVDLDRGEPHGGFERTLDLFGDGSVRLAATRGHTAGHLSVILRLAGDRELLLTGDAAYAIRSIDEDLLPLFLADDDGYRASLAAIRRWRDEGADREVICGHDPWTDLPELVA